MISRSVKTASTSESEAIRAGALGWLNAGRINKELERMCEEPDPRACFRELAGLLTGG